MARILVVFGTRPEAIKLSPVIHALRRRGLTAGICVTGQHRELLDQALDGIRPDIDLKLMVPGQSIATLASRMLDALDRTMAADQPDRVIVQGDTVTALAAAQAAFLRGIPVAHVEAGLRTGDLTQPWPEEGIRRAIAAWSDLHFAPTRRAADALLSEGVPVSRIHITGNTIVDAIRAEQARAGPPSAEVEALGEQIGSRRLILVTCHRRENVGGGVAGVAAALRTLAERSDALVVVLAHPNPMISGPLREMLSGADNVALVEPLPFRPFLELLDRAHFVLTDSGGVQEEAPLIGTPVLIARAVTERMESVEAGTAKLVGTDPGRIVAEASRLLDDSLHHARMARIHSPYGDGRAADRIADTLAAAETARDQPRPSARSSRARP